MDRDELLEVLGNQTRKEALEGLWHNWENAPEWFWQELLELLNRNSERIQISICWLIKRRLSLANDSELAQKLLANDLTHLAPMATVDLCQGLCQTNLAQVPADPIRRFLDHCLDHENVFLQAWSLSLLCHLAPLHPEWLDEARSRAEKAGNSEKASIRARVRNLRARYAFLN
ncbi:MAG: hypothetical protein KDC71_18685 [Acidobacteria bacterium]|nr:hypothetical protein [Acidobacteriota bacterium]